MRLRSVYVAVSACLFFFLAGQPFVPLLGVEADEALFGMAFLKPRLAASVRIGHSTFPLMIMTYLGTLKAWIYRPILRWFRPDVWTLREPALLAGAVSIWVFYLLLRRIAGGRAAAIGAVLLATDSLYLLTSCFDWGPVALQHLLITGGTYLLVRFSQEHLARPETRRDESRARKARRGREESPRHVMARDASLAGGAFLLGLALWDKTLAAWMISGLGIAALVLCWRIIASLFTWRRVSVAAIAFLLGSLPLLVYNARYDWATFRGNFHRDFTQFSGKRDVLLATVNGRGLFGYLAMEDPPKTSPHGPTNAAQRLSARIDDIAGHPRRNLDLYAVIAAILLAPFAGRTAWRMVLFALIAMTAAWLQMAITANAGGSVHHTILMWPLPYLIVAVSLAGVSQRIGALGVPAAAAITGVVAIAGILLTNSYYQAMLRNGGSESWNDAIIPLTRYVESQPATYLYCMDWGILDGLRFLSGGTLPVAGGDDRFTKPELTTEERANVASLLADGKNLYVAHTPDAQVFPDNPKFLKRAAALGFRRVTLAVISDSFGRPNFEVYRMAPASQ